jgi:Protein of unknown function (DUF1761)
MESINWLAVLLAAALALALGMVWHGPMFRTGRPLLGGPNQPRNNFWVPMGVLLIAAAMLGHNFARIGAATLGAKPWLYAMQSGGVALAFVSPAVWLTHARTGSTRRLQLIDSGFWVAAFLAMGAVFWALS